MSKQVQRRDFEKGWQHRFGEFAADSNDDAGIAGWSKSGLQTRFRFFASQWRRATPGGLYIDSGCGAGTYSRWLANLGLRVIGIDYSLASLIKARQREVQPISYCAADASFLPFPDNSADGILCFGVLQAVWESEPLILEAARVLKPGGELWIDALNSCGLHARWDLAWRKLRGKRMHLRYESPNRLAAILQRAGFEEISKYWLPIVPGRLQRLQPLFEVRTVQLVLSRFNLLGTLASHSVLMHAVNKK